MVICFIDVVVLMYVFIKSSISNLVVSKIESVVEVPRNVISSVSRLTKLLWMGLKLSSRASEA